MKIITAVKAAVVGLLAIVGVSTYVGISLFCSALGLGLSAIWGYGVYLMWTGHGVLLGIVSGVLAPWAWFEGLFHLISLI